MNPFSRARIAESPGPSERCLIFWWIGQTFEHCEECGNPLREHLYHPVYGRGRPELFVKRYVKHQD